MLILKHDCETLPGYTFLTSQVLDLDEGLCDSQGTNALPFWV